MSNEPINKTVAAFGRVLAVDPYNYINQVDDDTVIITPKFNTSGLQELKVGVLLPFSQSNDNLTAEIVWGGSSAIRMAANMINQQKIIQGAYITLIEKDSFPNENAEDQGAVTQAVYASVTLLQQGVIAVIGDVSSSWTTLSALITSTLEIPQCSFTANAIGFSDKSQYKYFYRTIPTKATLAGVMLDFIASQGWRNIGVIYDNDPLGQQFYQKVLNQATYRNLNVISYQPYISANITDLLKFIESSAMRIIMVGVTGTHQINLMKMAAARNLTSSEYVWLLMDDNSANMKDMIMTGAMDGAFMFDMKMSLYGYPPFEAFLSDWMRLDPEAYPYAGRRNVSTNEGPAFSCMMTMARGFNQTLSTISNHSLGLEMLSNRSLGSAMTPRTFDTGYLSPEGPLHYDSNGDLLTGNHHIFNIQRGNLVSIGRSIAGKFEFTTPPMYHDGTHQPPADLPPSNALNPSFSSMTSQIILGFTATGMFCTCLVLLLVIMFRKHDIFRASSPLFCCFELLGLLFTYTSVIFTMGIPTKTSCFLVPITFNFGFLLVLGNLIAKNYRIYRIFNNIFISRTVLTDFKLMKLLSVVISVNMAVLTIGLLVSSPEPVLVQVNPTSHYWVCRAAPTASRTIFLSFGAIYAGSMLIFATFLAYKTRSAGKHYDHYNECKQMGISVYNILFSALVGFTAMINPLANYYLKFYSVAVAILWATTFSLAVLFIPKVYIFYKQWRKAVTATETTDEPPSFSPSTTACHEDEIDDITLYSFLKSTTKKPSKDPLPPPSPVTLLSPIATSNYVHDDHAMTTTVEGRYDNTNVYVEVQEGDVPVRKAFKYFPFLSQWKMRRLMIFPRFGYISYYSEKTKKGTMISYTHASVYSSTNPEEDFILKIHGQDKHDVYIQLGDFITMESWKACLNQDIMKQQEQEEYIFRKRPSSTTITTSTSTSLSDSTCHHHHRSRRRSKSQPLKKRPSYPMLVSSVSSSSLASSFRNRTNENIM
ncbi:choline phosphate cytidylyltransferase [Mucor velutinosus]|uniref:Choline phosphate cytidylyltransferase n=1 Tax=Mucor velutinosus TaxID=708070 RepID=A0AAN7I2N5_9FUNG|nr:choline phosphate cytidylyltransferase [Mucor velutinosus]